ncbi:MAG: hypothetical protein KN64_05025 [Sulfurovum sp. AS07-7]|nr:MAG: hypothetical protein KN64_05025 [Sulfurovum sp. AS07-7]
MFKIILDQIAFKKIGMSEYDKLSFIQVWVLFALISIATSYIAGGSLGLWALNAVFGALTVYAIYMFLAFWFKKRDLWNGNGNILGLMITSSAIDILYIPAFLIHPALAGLLFVFSFAIAVNALKGALNISISQVLIAFLMASIVGVIVSIALGFLMENIAPALDIELPPVAEM